MNKKILTAAAILAAVSMANAAKAKLDDGVFKTWAGDDGTYQVHTGLDAGGEKSGYWYWYDDNGDGGESKIDWPVEIGNESDPKALDNVIDYCGGVCGTYTLATGTLKYKPFVGIGFNIAGTADPLKEEPKVAANASAWGGICMTYTLDQSGALELSLGDEGDAELKFDNPFAEVDKATTAATAKIAWSEFEQAGWGAEQDGKEISGPDAAAKLVAVKLKIQGKDATGKVNIMSFGPYDGECHATEPCGDECGDAAIGAKALKSSLKAQLSGRNLSFGKIVAKAEIVNLHGQVVMSASSVSTMDLAKLQAGVYMVRSMGLSQQIMLK